jgi:hypothetical protein
MASDLRPHRHLLLVVLASTLVFLVPTASATANLHGQFTASSAQAEGSNSVQGPLVALFQDNNGGADTKTNPAFILAANSLRVETYYFDPTLYAGGFSIWAKPETSSETYQDAQVQGLQNRPGYYWDVFSLGLGGAGIGIDSTCSDLAPSSQAQVERVSQVDYPAAPDKKLTASTANALSWTQCSGASSIKVTGNFVLMLWEWDATLHADGQDHPLPSGQSHSAYDPADTPETTNVVSYDRQRYLYVENGTLTASMDGSNYAAYLGPDAQLHTDSGLLFKGATGRLTEGTQITDLASSTVLVQGRMDLQARGTDTSQPFQGSLAGTAQEINVDGKAFAAVTAASPFGSSGWAYAVGALAFVLVAATIAWESRPWLAYRRFVREEPAGGFMPPQTWRQRRGAGYWALAREAFLKGRHQRSIHHSQRSERLFPGSLDAQVVRAFAFSKMERTQEALELHEQIQDSLPAGPERARVACHIARLCTRLAEKDRAMKQKALLWLRRAAAENPQAFGDEILDPSFDPLLSEPWFQAARKGYIGIQNVRREGYDPSFA